MTKQLKKASKVDVQQLHLKRRKQHRRLVGIVLLILALVVAVLLVFTLLTRINESTRLYRINQIYDSLGIDTAGKYIIQRENVFGDKRVYDYDKGRTFSSEKNYIRAAAVDVTAKELDTAIKNAGFEFFDEPYAGSMQIQYHYKSSKGEYIRMSVSSKLRDDAFQNEFLMTGKASDELFKIDPNAGPSNVTIKVNLDDNNE